MGTGYDSYYFYYFMNDLSSVDSKYLTYKSCEVLVRINMQTPDTAGGVHMGKSDLDVGAGDQGIVLGYASDETEVFMPLTYLLATSMGKKLPQDKTENNQMPHPWVQMAMFC